MWLNDLPRLKWRVLIITHTRARDCYQFDKGEAEIREGPGKHHYGPDSYRYLFLRDIFEGEQHPQPMRRLDGPVDGQAQGFFAQ